MPVRGELPLHGKIVRAGLESEQESHSSLTGFARFLALAAMLVQFAASYGHMHPEDFYRLLGSSGPVMVAMPGSGDIPIPAGPDEDGCAICQVMHMTGGSALPPPVLLALPRLTIIAASAAISPLLLSPPEYFLFRTRAPPIA